MRVLVVGAGAVGSLFGALLERAGHDVTLVARPAHVAAIRAYSLRVEGETTGVFPVHATEEIPDGEAPDLVLLTTKTFDLEATAEAVARRLSRPAPVLVPANGLGVEAMVERGLRRGGWPEPAAWVVRGVNSVPALLIAPGRVRHTGTGELLLADYASGRHAADLVEPLDGAGIPTRLAADREHEVWKKALVNAAINPLTADRGVTNGALARSPEREEALELLHEALSVAEAEGQRFDRAEAEAALWTVVERTASNRSSMLQDVERGRRTEIDSISGEILARGRARGLSLPATERLVERIRAREPVRSDGRRPPG